VWDKVSSAGLPVHDGECPSEGLRKLNAMLAWYPALPRLDSDAIEAMIRRDSAGDSWIGVNPPKAHHCQGGVDIHSPAASTALIQFTPNPGRGGTFACGGPRGPAASYESA